MIRTASVIEWIITVESDPLATARGSDDISNMKIFGFIILLGLFSNFCGKSSATGAKFGEKVAYSQNVPVKFEDFTLTYIGDRRVSSDVYPRGFLFHDFTAKTEREEKTVSWSSGTGDIGPAVFEIGGKKYALELDISEKLGILADHELVVWKK